MVVRSSRTLVETLLAGVVGAALFKILNLPAPWLSGAMVGVVALIVCGRAVHLPEFLRDLGLLLAGVAMGCAITPEMIQAMGRYPVSLALLALTLIGITLVGRFVLRRFFNWPDDVATFGSIPGAMSAVLATSASAGIDLSRVAIVQAFRMFMLVAILPSLIAANFPTGRAPDAAVISAPGFLIVMAAALLVSLLFDRWRVLAPFMFGGMFAGAVTHATGLIKGVPPHSIVDLSFFLIGVFAGSRIYGMTAAGFRSMFLPALLSFIAAMVVTVIGAGLAILFAGASPAEALIAFAPGGLEAMVVLGMAMGLDPLYVSSHHVARFVMISAALPILARRLRG